MTNNCAEPSRNGESDNSLEEFLLAEYATIAQAHFNTLESLSNFVKHYIAIASIPFVALVILFGADTAQLETVSDFFSQHPLLVLGLLWVLSAIGWCLLAYVINIRLDTLLYARAVNGIRNHYFSKARLRPEAELATRVLPRSNVLPNYRERLYFGWVVAAFALVGALYVGTGFYYVYLHDDVFGYWSVILTILWFGAHPALYRILCSSRERSYLQRREIGIDIDGVLNDHRTQFSRLLVERAGKQMLPDEIVHIPVHEMTGGNVSEAEANSVFNWPLYWTNMQLAEPTVAETIRKIKDGMGYKVWIFTHRPWPNARTMPREKLEEYWNAWRQVTRWAPLARRLAWLDVLLTKMGIRSVFHGRVMRGVTKRWLKRNRIPFDHLVIEMTGAYRPDVHTRKSNRFAVSRFREMRLFVEDDLAKARQLANICEFVFLMDHPYNQCDPLLLPNNVIRVMRWGEILKFVREKI